MTRYDISPYVTRLSARRAAEAMGVLHSGVQPVRRSHRLKARPVETFEGSGGWRLASKAAGAIEQCRGVPDKGRVLYALASESWREWPMAVVTGDVVVGSFDEIKHVLGRANVKLLPTGNLLERDLCTGRKKAQKSVRAVSAPRVVVDSDAMGKIPAVKRSPAAHPRFHLRLMPPLDSWFHKRDLLLTGTAQRRIPRGVFR